MTCASDMNQRLLELLETEQALLYTAAAQYSCGKDTHQCPYDECLGRQSKPSC